MQLKRLYGKYYFRAIIVGIGITSLAIISSSAFCGFSFGDVSCPSPEASVWLGAFVGAVTTALFFYLIDNYSKKILEKFDKEPMEKNQILKWLIGFVVTIFVLSIISSRTYCGFSFGNASCPIQEVQIWLGAFVGAVTSALFFFLIGKNTTYALEKLGKLYVARTCVLNLRDIFGIENGKGRIKKTE